MTIRPHGIVLRPTEGEDNPAQAAPIRLEEMPMTFQPPYRPSGRSVWLGKDLVQTDDWIVRLSSATLKEIDASVSRFRGCKAYDMPVSRDEFPLTTMAEDLARMRQEIATGRGFFVFRGLDKDPYSDNELGLIFRIGVFVETDRKSTRLNSSHRCISYAVFCLKKKKKII